MEKQDTGIINMTQETSTVVHISVVASIEEIKEVDPECPVSETIYASGDLNEKNIKEDVLEVEVSD